MPRGKLNKRYTPEFKIKVVETMHKEKLSYCSYKGDVGKTAPNLLERDFKADKPNQKWVTDVIEFALFGIKLYLSPINDLYNGEVVSYNLSCHPNLAQTTDMLEKVIAFEFVFFL